MQVVRMHLAGKKTVRKMVIVVDEMMVSVRAMASVVKPGAERRGAEATEEGIDLGSL
jgi:hypothetical protein